MMMDDPIIVVMGLGNILLGDEGLGIHAVRALEKRFRRPQIVYYDGGTRGLSLLPFMEEASHLMILDAVRTQKEPGTLVEIGDEDLSASIPLKFCAHDIALQDLLTLLRLRNEANLKSIVLLGLVPRVFTFSTELSPEIQESLPELIRRAEKTLEGWLAAVKPAA
jgi:hydrogenase maturation protease